MLHVSNEYDVNLNNKKFSTVDVLALISMKNAAKCDKQCELQTVSHQNFECNLHLRLARGMFASVYLSLSNLISPAVHRLWDTYHQVGEHLCSVHKI